MKIKWTLLFICLLSFSSIAFAQTVKITPKKTVYKRPAREGFESKRMFTIIYPKVSGLTAALNRKVENAISYQRVFDLNLKEEINDAYWLESADFKTEYNKNGILGVALTVEGSGAYPSTYTKHVVVDMKTGSQLKPADVFASGKIPALAKMLNGHLQETIKQAIADTKKDSADDAQALTEMLAEKKFTLEELKHFSVNDKGVTFYYDYGFPHVNLALEPNGEFFVPYSQIKSFIKPEGLLGKFVR